MAQKSFEELDLCNSFLFSAAMEEKRTVIWGKDICVLKNC